MYSNSLFFEQYVIANHDELNWQTFKTFFKCFLQGRVFYMYGDAYLIHFISVI